MIVNTPSSDLNLDYGVLSKTILQAAGQQLQNECVQNYPNGITLDEIAVTGAGLINSVSKIFHVLVTGFKDQKTSSKVNIFFDHFF